MKGAPMAVTAVLRNLRREGRESEEACMEREYSAAAATVSIVRRDTDWNQSPIHIGPLPCENRRMNETESTLPHSPVATTQTLREWLGVLVLSTGILRRHGAVLSEADRIAQREIMHEAGARLTGALARGT